MIFNGDRLRWARKYKGLTMDELINLMAERYSIKVNRGMISRWENRKAVPRDETKKALSEILEISLDYLLGRVCYEYVIIELRHKNKMSVEELSKKSGVQDAAIALIELELDEPSKDDLQKIGKVFGYEDFHTWLLENNIPVYAEDVGLIKEETADLKEITFFLDQKEITYNGHTLTELDRKRILSMIETLFPEYQ